MIGIFLVAAHMAGDYLFQSSGMAANKLQSRWWRTYHVAVYTACFVPVTLWSVGMSWASVLFLSCLFVAHWFTDAKRWRTSNPWPAMPILQDQSLHAVQIAVFAGLFLAP